MYHYLVEIYLIFDLLLCVPFCPVIIDNNVKLLLTILDTIITDNDNKNIIELSVYVLNVHVTDPQLIRTIRICT